MSNNKDVETRSPKAYGLHTSQVTASKFTIPKVETMRKSYYLKDNIFKSEKCAGKNK